MLVLDREAIRSVFTMRDAIEADKAAFVLHSEGKTQVPLRSSLDVGKGRGQCLFMPAYAEGVERAGVKIVSVFPGNAQKGKPVVPATVILLDGETGEVDALLEGTVLTQMRTAAISGAATELLSRQDASTAALFGTGGQAEAQLEALLTVRSLRRVFIFDVARERSEAFVSRVAPMAARFGATLHVASSSGEAVAEAQIITTVTTSTTPVFDGNLVAPGTHVNGVGAYRPDMQELDLSLLERAGRIFVDSLDAVLSEAGDFLIPQAHGRFAPERIAGELGDLLLGRVPGRTSPEEITVMKTVGFAALDVVSAAAVVEKAREANVGRTLAL